MDRLSISLDTKSDVLDTGLVKEFIETNDRSSERDRAKTRRGFRYTKPDLISDCVARVCGVAEIARSVTKYGKI
jgi:hypothetical protein